MSKLFAARMAATLLPFIFITPVLANDTGIAYALHDIKAERGQVCMVGHFHHGKSGEMSSKKAAYKAAVQHWVSFTALEYGSDWGSFNKAASRSKSCEKVSANGFVCKVKGRPCRSGRNLARR